MLIIDPGPSLLFVDAWHFAFNPYSMQQKVKPRHRKPGQQGMLIVVIVIVIVIEDCNFVTYLSF